MNFKQFFQITEVSQSIVSKMDENLKKLLTDRKLPFEHIFGPTDLRIAEEFKGDNQYEKKIKGLAGAMFDLDMPNWVGYKLEDKDKKNPIKIGKLLVRVRENLVKTLKNAIDEIKQHVGATEDDKQRSIEYNSRGVNAKIAEIDELLKTVELQKQYQQGFEKWYVIYSRAPIDVLRMSDHDWRSCHSPEGSYFNCAVADSMLNAGIAYLVTGEDFAKIKNLQDKEIFVDYERDVDGINPKARIRLRALIDNEGHTVAVPSAKLYALDKYKTHQQFVAQVLEWSKRQDVSDFEWDNVLHMLGGSYQDMGHEIDYYVKHIWGKDVTVLIDGEEGENDNLEHQLDALREYVNENINWETEFLWDSSETAQEICPIEVEFNTHAEQFTFSYDIDDEFIKMYNIDQEKLKHGNLSLGIKIRNEDYSIRIQTEQKYRGGSFVLNIKGTAFQLNLIDFLDGG